MTRSDCATAWAGHVYALGRSVFDATQLIFWTHSFYLQANCQCGKLET